MIVPARSARIIPGSVTTAAGGQIYYGVVEELESAALPRWLIVSPVCVAVDQPGRIPCSVANLGREDLYLKPNTVLGCMHAVQSMDGILPDGGEATVSEMATGQDENALTAEQWLDVGILRESSSAYAAPIVIVRKKTGEMRMCVDYRALNAKMPRDAYPLPRIEEALDILRGAVLLQP